MKQLKPSARHTVLLIGEGKTEQAFFKHLKSLYIFRGCGVAVKIHTAKGKGPEYIVNYAVRRSRRFESERILTLLDTDIAIKDSIRKQADEHNIQLVESEPCFEGLLLAMLGKSVPRTSKQCKQQCGKIFSAPLTTQESYQELLTRDILDQRRSNIPALSKILGSFFFDD